MGQSEPGLAVFLTLHAVSGHQHFLEWQTELGLRKTVAQPLQTVLQSGSRQMLLVMKVMILKKFVRGLKTGQDR